MHNQFVIRVYGNWIFSKYKIINCTSSLKVLLAINKIIETIYVTKTFIYIESLKSIYVASVGRTGMHNSNFDYSTVCVLMIFVDTEKTNFEIYLQTVFLLVIYF